MPKQSDYPPASALDGTELWAIDQGGTTKKVTAAQMASVGPGVQAMGGLPSGQTVVRTTGATGSGNISGTTDFRAWNHSIEYDGANSATDVHAENMQTTLLHTAGTVTFAYGLQGYLALGVPSTLTTTGSVTTMRGVEFHISHTGTGNVSSAYCFNGFADLDVGSGTISQLGIYRADDFTAGSGNRITSVAAGLLIANQSVCSCPTVAAVYTEMSAGSGRFNLYFNGSAPSVMVGGLRIGDLNSPTRLLEVAGDSQFLGHVGLSLSSLVNAANDAAAATAGVAVGDIYRNGSILMIRVS